jgi:hypothetical protein
MFRSFLRWRFCWRTAWAHGRRQFVEVAANFPDECRCVLEMLGQVYGHDAEARERTLTPQERLQFHQVHSGPGAKRRWESRRTVSSSVLPFAFSQSAPSTPPGTKSPTRRESGASIQVSSCWLKAALSTCHPCRRRRGRRPQELPFSLLGSPPPALRWSASARRWSLHW